MKILIADDEIEIRKVLRLLLENAGHTTVEASDGERAVEAVRLDSEIDLCIMDITMPRVDGVEATKRIREFSTLPILFLTARSLESEKEAAYSGGGDDYLVKPFSSRELLMKVEALTRRYTSYSAKEKPNETIRLWGGVVLSPESVWGDIPLPSSNNTVTVHILNLRRKLEEDTSSPRIVRTVWGKGYQID